MEKSLKVGSDKCFERRVILLKLRPKEGRLQEFGSGLTQVDYEHCSRLLSDDRDI